MTDRQLILFLCRLLWDEITDGDSIDGEDLKKISDELRARGEEPDEIFGT